MAHKPLISVCVLVPVPCSGPTTSHPMRLYCAIVCLSLFSGTLCHAAELQTSTLTPSQVLDGLRTFYKKSARPDGSFQPGVDPDISACRIRPTAIWPPVTYAVVSQNLRLEIAVRGRDGTVSAFPPAAERRLFQCRGNGRSGSPRRAGVQYDAGCGRTSRPGRAPRHNPLPVFEEILKQDYQTLPAYSTSFFPLAYLCVRQADSPRGRPPHSGDDDPGGRRIFARPHRGDVSRRPLFRLVGEPTPKAGESSPGRFAIRKRTAVGS